ncbi:hypothetical protein GCM10010924_39270 [Rhizobium wenxiniae]|uniref:Uncharacterized protein n=1 Tax=Rhizobium wenxiniae TaxID=1737357 RepID=A0A7W9Y9Z9_9HYPH|nr:hypothetical protein [Rhizobium wenxiniae]MBB6164661.1 hypothetical protein [Rhizobium wenxiniae]GGG06684.1 hypothetical protein GCM10010924_39270 [Rhizobium wenxiniae]
MELSQINHCCWGTNHFEDNDLYAAAFEDGCCAARVGKFVTANSCLDRDSVELAAWVDGFASINTAELIPLERMEIWLMGYVPHSQPNEADIAHLQPSYSL